MADTIIYAQPVKIARANAVLGALDAAASPARLLVCSGASPANVGAPAAESILVTLALPRPSGVVNSESELVMGVIPEAMIIAAGVAAWAQLQTGDGTPIANMAVGEIGSGAAIVLGETSLDVGSLLRITAAKLIEP